MVGEDPDQASRPGGPGKVVRAQELDSNASPSSSPGPGFNLLLAVLLLMVVLYVLRRARHVDASERGGERLSRREGRYRKKATGSLPWTARSGRGVGRAFEWQSKASGGKPLELQIRRGEETVNVTVQPTQKEGKTIFGERKDDWIIGIGSQVTIEKGNPGLPLSELFTRPTIIRKITLLAFYKMIFGDVSPRNIGGPILIAQMAGQQAQEGLGSFFAFLAVLSINLGCSIYCRCRCSTADIYCFF